MNNPPDTPRYRDKTKKSKIRSFFNYLAGKQRKLEMVIFGCSEEEMIQFLKKIKTFKPHILIGYSNSLCLLAQIAKNHNITGMNPGAIIYGAETLLPEGKKLLEEVFQCNVYCRYGSREFDIIASDCSHGNLHINEDNLIVEIVEESGSTAGRILITDLNNYAIPEEDFLPVVRRTKSIFDEETRIQIEKVEEIPLTRGGKYNYFISELE